MILNTALAYEVIQDVNDPAPPEVAYTIFEKGKGIDHLKVTADKNTQLSLLEDGRLRIRLEGDQWANIFIHWTEDSGIPKSINLRDYRSLVLRGHLEGYAKIKGRRSSEYADADIATQPIAFVLITLAEEWVNAGKINEGSSDGKNPVETTDLIFPMSYFIPGFGQDVTTANGIGFRMVGRSGQKRQYDLILEKIVITK